MILWLRSTNNSRKRRKDFQLDVELDELNNMDLSEFQFDLQETEGMLNTTDVLDDDDIVTDVTSRRHLVARHRASFSDDDDDDDAGVGAGAVTTATLAKAAKEHGRGGGKGRKGKASAAVGSSDGGASAGGGASGGTGSSDGGSGSDDKMM
jgi:hypothetical protein